MIAVAIQTAIVPPFSLLGGQPDLIFLLVVSWSLNAPLEQGVVWAFVGGLCKDLMSAAPLGTSTLGIILIVFGIRVVRLQIYSVGLFTLVWIVLLGTLIQQLLTFIIIMSAGFSPAFADQLGYGIVLEEISYIILPTIVYNLVAIVPIYWFVRRIQQWIGLESR
jgi:rod shape-determining protein MreD